MTRAPQAAALGLALAGWLVASCAPRPIGATTTTPNVRISDSGLAPPPALEDARHTALDHLFADPILAHALVTARIESLRDGRVLYARRADALVIPASALKLVTAAVAADRLGWNFRFTTRLETDGPIANGVLTGDLIVTSDGDPSIAGQDLRASPLFVEWAGALRTLGVRRIDGRIVGDDTAFDDEPLGAGWAWDYLTAGYAAPSGALSYNENVVVARISPGGTAGTSATVEIGPPGHELDIVNEVRTTGADVPASIAFARHPGSSRLTIRGSTPVGSGALVRTTTIDNPTRFFVEAFRLALADAGIPVTGGAWDIDAAPLRPASGRRLLAEHRSAPLSSLIGYAMKVSQNFYGDMLLKAVGRHAAGGPASGSSEAGRQVVRQTLAAWNLPADALVMYDGSGLSRYNYVSADLLVGVLRRAWTDERLRGPFVASLPVGGHDGTLENRMRNSILDRRVQAKTGTITNVRSLAGYAETSMGEKLVFAIVANHFTAPNAQVDAIMERVLEEVIR